MKCYNTAKIKNLQNKNSTYLTVHLLKKLIFKQVFQSRFNGKQDFFKDWESYIQGFGKLEEEFWLGNCFFNVFNNHIHTTG